MFILDTNVVSELRLGRRCNAGVSSWYEGFQGTELFTSALVSGEIRKGTARLRLRQDYRQADI
jgi:predicted nucleic acid-binding protein